MSAATTPELLTFLLSDVEDSTGLWQDDVRAMAGATAELDALFSDVVSRHGGERPVEQGEGDSHVAVFPSALTAAGCAVELQDEIGRRTWPTSRPVRIRIGLHTGSVDVATPSGYRGRSLNRCARLRDLGRGGHILVSGATAELLADDLPVGWVLEDLGSHELRGLDREERVLSLRHPSAPQGPVLRELVAHVGSLPEPATELVGRQSVLAHLVEETRTARLVTLVGAGGVGKTRLALEVARSVRRSYHDGAWWIDLSVVADGPSVAGAVLRALGSPASGHEALLDLLRDRQLLVVLDNCEHLLDAVADLAASIGAQARHVRILTTSREALGLTGERAHRLDSLTLPDDDSSAGVLASEAGQLFLERARAVRPGFALDDVNSAAVAAVCRRLDGLPLAVELAAAQVAILTPGEIAAALGNAFALLTGNVRAALPRQRTLEASVQWSYDLLHPAEQALFRRIAAFSGGFDLEGAMGVCTGGDVDAAHLLVLLKALVDKSLLVAEPLGARTRYRMLETVHAFGRQLLSANEGAAVRDLHLAYFLDLAERLEPLVLTPDVSDVLARMDQDLANLRSAVDWALARGHGEAALRIVGCLWLYWFARDLSAEGLERVEQVLAAAPGSAPQYRMKALSGAMLATVAGDPAELLRLSEQATRLASESQDLAIRCRAVTWSGFAQVWMGEGAGLPELEQGLALARELGDPAQLGRCLHWLGMELALRGEHDRGLALVVEAVEVFRRTQNLAQLGWALAFQGAAESHGPDPGKAVGTLTEGIRLLRILRQATFVGVYQGVLGFTLIRLGEAGIARELALDACQLLRRAGQPPDSAAWLLALVEAVGGNLPAARQRLAEVTRPAPRPQILGIVTELSAGWVALLDGDVGGLRTATRAALDLTRFRPAFRADALDLTARLQELEGRREDAVATAREAVRSASGARYAAGLVYGLDTLVALRPPDPSSGRWLGAVDAEASRLGLCRLPCDEVRRERTIARLTAALGEAEFLAAMAAGAAMSLDDASEQSLRGTGTRRSGLVGWENLTPSEWEVTRLAAGGLTNPQIAERLFISRHTVKVHLGHVFAKLGMAGRAELAGAFARLEIAHPHSPPG